MQQTESLSFADMMKNELSEMWEYELYNHPFVVELSSGKLPRKKYENYLAQNHYFPIEYSRCVAIAATRAQDALTMSQFMKISSHALDSELAKFDQFAIAFGVKESALRVWSRCPKTWRTPVSFTKSARLEGRQKPPRPSAPVFGATPKSGEKLLRAS